MTTKVRYTLSAIERDKVGPGWHVRATPNAYAPELIVNFDSEEEALTWLRQDSIAWLAKLEAARNSKRPRDTNQLAKLMVDILTGEVEDREPTPEEQGKDPVAASRGKKGGLKGGRARAALMSPEERKASAQKAANARWKRS